MPDLHPLELSNQKITKDNWDLIWLIAYCNNFGIGVAKNTKKAIELWQEAAKDSFWSNGHAWSQAFLGYTSDYWSIAEKRLLLAAKQNNAHAQNSLGYHYLSSCHYNSGDNEEALLQAKKYFALAIKQGFAVAQHNYAVLLHNTEMGCYDDDDHNKDYSKILAERLGCGHYWQLAAAQGYPDALYELVKYHREDYDPKKSLEYYCQLVKGGDSKAIKRVNELFKEWEKKFQENLDIAVSDKHASKDVKKALEYFHLAANYGWPEAQFKLGCCYEQGNGVTKELKKAVEQYQLAAKQGLTDAQIKLGVCYENGNGVAKDVKNAMEYYRLAADQGNPNAKTNLERLLKENPYLVEQQFQQGLDFYMQKNYSKAIECWQKLAQPGLGGKGHAEAQLKLGTCYEDGTGLARDKKKAVALYQLAAEQGLAYAQYKLGFCYENGIGITIDTKKAAIYYQSAAEQRCADAQCDLGACYEDGIGVVKDVKRAAELYQLAVDQRHARAQVLLGICFARGAGVPKDEKRATELYQLATNKKDAGAQHVLGWCYDTGTGVKKDEKMAAEFYRLAANQGNGSAQHNLGVCYENGLGVAKDLVKAIHYYQLAANQGKTHAQYQ